MCALELLAAYGFCLSRFCSSLLGIGVRVDVMSAFSLSLGGWMAWMVGSICGETLATYGWPWTWHLALVAV